MILKPRFCTQFTAFTAVLAILLLFVAPSVSQWLIATQDHSPSMPGSHQSDSVSHHPTEHPSDAHRDHHSVSQQSTSVDKSDAQQSQLACQYCDLILHVPFMVWQSKALLWLLLIIQATSFQPAIHTSLVPSIRRPYAPRAPPCC